MMMMVVVVMMMMIGDEYNDSRYYDLAGGDAAVSDNDDPQWGIDSINHSGSNDGDYDHKGEGG